MVLLITIISSIITSIAAVIYFSFHAALIMSLRKKDGTRKKKKQPRRCACSECGPQGAILAQNEWDTHNRRERKRHAINQMISGNMENVSQSSNSLDSQHATPPPISPSPPPSPSPSVLDLSSKPRLSPTPNQAVLENPTTTEDKPGREWCLNTLEYIERRLTPNATQELRRWPLVFRVRPSGTPILNDSLLSLDHNSTLNTAVLDHENWLIHYRDLLRTLADKHKQNAHISLRIAKVLRKLESGLNSLTKVKALEWKNQQHALKGATGSHLVDSRGSLMSHPNVSHSDFNRHTCSSSIFVTRPHYTTLLYPCRHPPSSLQRVLCSV